MEYKDKFKEVNGQGKWRKMFDFFDNTNTPIRVWKDWISYGDFGFNPQDPQKLKDYENMVDVLKFGLEKWKKEFGKNIKE